MEEFIEKKRQSGFKTQYGLNDCQLSQSRQDKGGKDSNRHFSMISRSQLNNRISQIQKKRYTDVLIENIFDSMTSQQLFRKVHAFLLKMIAEQSFNKEVVDIFSKTSQENSSSSSCNSNKEILSEKSSAAEISSEKITKLKQISNKYFNQTNKRDSLIKAQRHSLMSKNNIISIADAINICQLKTYKNNLIIEQTNNQSSMQESDNNIQLFEKKSLNSISSHEVAKRTEVRKECLQKSKKISIAMPDFQEFSVKSESSLGVQCLPTLAEIDIPELQFNVKMVEYIFETPVPFLINLSLCLLFKLLKMSKKEITKENAVWLMTISTLISYKIYYDEPINDLIYCFSQILGTQTETIRSLQVWFLNKLNYQVNIESNQYYTILCKWALS